MTITPEQLAAIQAAVAEAVRSETGKAVSPESISAAVAEFMRAHGGAAPGIVPGNIAGVRVDPPNTTLTAEQRWARLAQITQNAIDASMGAKPRHEGIDLPKMRDARDAYFARTGQSTTTTAGGYLIPTEEVLQPVDLVGAEESLIGACNRVPMQTGSITIVTTDGDITVYWVPETTDTSSMSTQGTGLKQESQFTLGRVTLTRHTVVALVKMSRQVMNYSQGYMENFLRTRLPMRLRKACEIAILRGTATAASDPVTGLDTLITGSNVVPWNAADPFEAVLATLYAPELALPGVAETSLAVTGPRGIISLRRIKDNNGVAILGKPQDQKRGTFDLFGTTCQKSANVLATYPAAAGTDTRFYAGDFARHAHVGFDDSLFVLVDPYSDAKNNLVNLIYEMSFGFTVTSASAFAYTDIPR